MRRARFIRPSWSRKRAPCRAFSDCSRPLPNRGCSAPFTPTAARITSTHPKPAARSTKSNPPQVGRGLAQLCIAHTPSYSPEARGRMERVFGTLQSRLPPELRLAEITTLEAANRYLKQEFVPDYNARFAVPAAAEGSAFIPYTGRALEDVLCLQETRQVGRDNCVN